jgi:hypothetical protein
MRAGVVYTAGMAFRPLSAWFFVPAAAIASACYMASANDTTFHKDVEPILQAHCQGCHTQGGIAPFPLITYDDAKANGVLMAARTAAKIMPPWGAQETASCTPRFKWQHDPRLSDSEIATIAAWSQTGMQEGNPADAPAPMSSALGLSGVQMELAPSAPYTVTVDNSDSFRCFVLDPKLVQDGWVNGSNIVPGNAEVVHHVVVFTDPAGATKAMTLGPDGGYDCFGGVGFTNTSVLMAWAPGMLPQDFPPNVGTKLTAGTRLVAQVHYHPHTVAAATSSKTDLTKIQLRFNSATPEYSLTSALIGNFPKAAPNGDGFVYDPTDPAALPTFVIPAGAKDVTVTQRFTLPPILNGQPLPQLYLYGVGGHMHWVGTKVEIDIHRLSPPDSQPEDECAIGIPSWDFNWQRIYHYDTNLENLPSLRQFDQITIKCTYDNTLDNPKVQLALQQQGLAQPKDVKLGETTLDEMCLGLFQVVFKQPP